MSNTITIKLNEDDRKVLDGILVMLCEINSRMGNHAEPTVAQTEAVEETIAPAAETLTEAAMAPQEAKKEPTVTHDDIRKKVVALSAAGKKDQVREVIAAVATKVSDIPEDKLADVLTALNALEG